MKMPLLKDLVSVQSFDGHSVEVYKVGRDTRGVMAALPISPDAADRLAIAGYEPPAVLHCTLAYCGHADEHDAGALDRARDALGALAMFHSPVKGVVGGVGRFGAGPGSDGKEVVYASLDAPGLEDLRQAVVRVLEAVGVPVRHDHGFTPHITLAYVEPGARLDEMPERLELEFTDLVFQVANVVSYLRFGGVAKKYHVGSGGVEVPPKPETPPEERGRLDPDAVVKMVVDAVKALPAPILKVEMPPLEPHIVTPIVPPAPEPKRARKVKKTVVRDDDGRISHVIEEELG